MILAEIMPSMPYMWLGNAPNLSVEMGAMVFFFFLGEKLKRKEKDYSETGFFLSQSEDLK